MWSKALWSREYRQIRWVAWLFPIAHFVLLGLQRLNTWVLDEAHLIQHRVDQLAGGDYLYYEFTSIEAGPRFFLSAMLALFALMLLGAERRNGIQEFLFSLPYARRAVYGVKWMLGVGVATASVVLNHALDLLVVLNSPAADYVDYRYHWEQAAYTWLFLCAVYALMLFIGSICGSVASQAVLSFVAVVLPIVLTEMIRYSLQLHGVGSQGDWWAFAYDYNLVGYMLLDYDHMSASDYAVTAALFGVATFAGMLAFERNKTENNGKLMLFSAWERVLQVGFVLCAALLGGCVLASIFETNEIFWYYTGLLVGFALGGWIILRLSRMRLKI